MDSGKKRPNETSMDDSGSKKFNSSGMTHIINPVFQCLKIGHFLVIKAWNEIKYTM